MKSILRYFLILFFYLSSLPFANLNAQGSNGSSWAKKFEYQKSFIENKGQFTIPKSFGNNSPILFAVDHGGTKIFFTKKGITYTFLEASKKQKDEREKEREREEEFKNPEEHARHEKEEHQLKVKADQVTMLWQNANSNVEIIADDATSDYHNYNFKESTGSYNNVSNVKGFKKITYKNMYPNIDIEYIFSEKGGLKYSLILHPGANPSQVKMVYDNNVQLNNAGEIRINTKLGDIVDHAPLSFYQNNNASIISSNFIKTGNTVSFQLANYDNTKTVVIDPWTQTPTYATNWDCVWECETDGAGNVYTIGGVMPMQLIKYNAAGVLQWTYNTPYDTTSWLGTMAVDNLGNSYVTQGSVAKIVKVSPAGAVVWNNANPGGLFLSTEFWNITFNCDQTRLIIGGTGGSLPPLPYIYEMNMSNGNVVSSIQITPGALIPTQEVRSIAPSGNGRYYFLTHDTIGYVNQNFAACSSPNAAIHKISNSYSFGYKCENFRYNNSGIMAIKANTSFVYTHRGNQLDKRNLNTSAIISSVAIPGGGWTTGFGGNSVQNSGIDIDDCGNVYVGSKNAVIKFDANLNQLASYPTTFNVYDVHVTTGGNIIACGSTGTSATNSRTGTIQHINAGACNTLSLTCCDVNICQPPSLCTTGSAINLQASTAGGTWSGTGITNATTGTFNPATAGVGSHVITYSLACGVGTTTINVTACGTVSLCVNNGSLTASGGAGTYTWSSTTTSVNCSACPGGNCIPFICAGTTVPTWTATGTTVAAPSATVFPIKVKDIASGVTFTFTTLASIPTCSVTVCPTLSLSVTSQTNVNCFGSNTGTATVNPTNGTGPYTYTWSPGNLSGASQSALSAGIYTIAIKDANNCTGTGTVSITQPTASLSAVISATSAAGCGSSSVAVFWTENFGLGCNQNQNANGVNPSINGAWAVTNTGTNNADANQWFISATESGMGVGICGDGCLGAGTTNRTLHISNVSTSPAAFLFCPTGDCGAAYDTGIGANNVAADKRAESPTINCTGQSNITLNFNYIEGGQTTIDDATLWYFNGTVWAQLDNMPKTVVCGGSQGQWASRTVVLPASANNNPNIKIGYRWVNNDDGAGSDPSFAVDDITLSATTTTGASGGATVTASGGTAGYTYSWTPSGGTTAGVNNLGSGSNSVTITDSKGCTANAVANITSIGGPTLSVVSQASVACFGASTGTATVVGSGGTGPYTYIWNPGNLIGASQTTLSAGTYTINATDANQCTGTTTLTITQPTASLTAAITATTTTGCGVSTGGATVTASGGTAGYTYSWTPSGGTTAGVTNLGSGSNSVTVTDSKGCTVTAVTNITTAGGPTLSVVSQASVTCFGASTGTASVVGSGGTTPYTYTWNPGNLTGASQTGLSAGIYTINVVDAGLCAGSGTLLITQPTTSLTAAITATTPTGCGTSTGGATVTANGGTPGYTYSWVPSGATGSGANGLSVGNNTVIVTDANSCSVTAVANITIVSIADVTIIPSSTIIPCFTGSVSLTANSSIGGPYTYVWSPSVPSFTGSTFVVSNSGTYTVVAINTANSCTASATQNITEESINASFVANPTQGFVPLPVTFTNTSVNPTGTTYDWNFGNTTTSTSTVSTLSTIYDTQGLFPVTLIATNGSCQDTAIIYIKVELLSSIIVPNVFTPNNDGSNDVFTLQAVNIGEINITIFDRWGLKMFEVTDSGNIKWDGKTLNGKAVPDGTYFYVLKAEGLDGKKYDLNGSINVFK